MQPFDSFHLAARQYIRSRGGYVPDPSLPSRSRKQPRSAMPPRRIREGPGVNGSFPYVLVRGVGEIAPKCYGCQLQPANTMEIMRFRDPIDTEVMT